MKAYKLHPKDKAIKEGLKTFKERKIEYKYKTKKICEKIFEKKEEEKSWQEASTNEEVKIQVVEEKHEINEEEDNSKYSIRFIIRNLMTYFTIFLAFYVLSLKEMSKALVNRVVKDIISFGEILVHTFWLWCCCWRKRRRNNLNPLEEEDPSEKILSKVFSGNATKKNN